jgi:hypothetical protein
MELEERFKPIQAFLAGKALGFESTDDAVDFMKFIRSDIKRAYGVDVLNLYVLHTCLLARGVRHEDMRGEL